MAAIWGMVLIPHNAPKVWTRCKVFCLQAAFVDGDAASTAMQAVAPVGVKLLKHERCILQDDVQEPQ